jgi:hypothetical protein
LESVPPKQEGIFMVTSKVDRQPEVDVDNDTDAVMHLLMNDSEGNATEMVIQPHQTGQRDVPAGHYEAKVFDEAGKVRSSYGTVDIAEFRKYKAKFIVEMGGTYRFHIGD